jgi:hypothetical protein
MAKVLLQFYKTERDLKDNSISFNHTIHLQVLPKVGSKFTYQEWMYKMMNDKAQREFIERYNFQPGEFYVFDKTDYNIEVSSIDYAFYLIEKKDEEEYFN